MANAQKDPNRDDRKFYFDLHNFDDPNESLDGRGPITYSQEEFDAAKTQAHEQGRQQGLNEAANAREQQIARLLQQISTQFATLFAAETERESRYEQEVVALTFGALEKLFPAMNEKIGGFEARHAVQNILKSASDQSEITIRIPPDCVAEIEAIVAPLRAKDINPPTFHIIGDAALGPGECRLSWADGGAVRNATQLSRTIFDALMALLPPGALDPLPVEETADENNDITMNKPDESAAPGPAPDDSAPSGPQETSGEPNE